MNGSMKPTETNKPDYTEEIEEMDEYIARKDYWDKWVEV